MDKRIILFVLLFGIVIVGCAGPQVQRGDDVLITYTGHYAENGTVFDTNDIANSALFDYPVTRYTPLAVRIGGQQVIPGFENAILGMHKGETKKNVTIKAVDAYGGYDPAKTVSLPKRIIIPLEAVVNRTVVVPIDKVPAELRDVSSIGRNISTGSFLYSVKALTPSDMTLFIEKPVNETIMLEGYTWNSTLVRTYRDAYVFKHNILVGAVYETPYGPFVSATVNTTHAVLNTTIVLGEQYRTSAGLGKAVRDTDSSITVDFNHPLAGYDLSFDITVTDIVPKK